MTHHDHDLPLPDYDSLPTGSIESRIRALDADGVTRVLDYERQHADRVQIVQLLQHRLDGLRRGDVVPSGGDPTAGAPEVLPGQHTGAAASPATEGPPQNPPSHGVPTNPAQPRG
jgi:hypothetical protein